MTGADWLLMILAVASVVPTLMTLIFARNDRTLRRRMGVNGLREWVATNAVKREWQRIAKHVALCGSVACTLLGTPQPWIAMLVCWGLSATSMWELVCRWRFESKFSEYRPPAKP